MQNNQLIIDFKSYLNELYGKSYQMADNEFRDEFFRFSGFFRNMSDLLDEEDIDYSDEFMDWDFDMNDSLNDKKNKLNVMCKVTLDEINTF